MLPYFRRIETYHIEGPGGLNKFQHGSNGPVNVLAGNREYGLRDPVRDAYQEIGEFPTSTQLTQEAMVSSLQRLPVSSAGLQQFSLPYWCLPDAHRNAIRS